MYDENKQGKTLDTSEGDEDMKHLFNLQLFGDGSSGAEGAESGVANPSGGEGLSNVVYGKPSGDVTNPKEKAADTPEARKAQFEEMIKGDYKDVFAERTQKIIDERFKKTKGLEEKLKSINPILETLSVKYGTDANDIDALLKAIDDDESYFQQAALDRGMTVKQYKETVALERQNAELQEALQKQQQAEEVDKIFAEWNQQASDFSERYQIKDFDLRTEIENPDFANLLKSGVSVEAAYKAIHFDDMVGGAMAHTAAKVKEDLVKSINGRASRPAEGAVASHSATTFKTDVNALTKQDIMECLRRAERGETITF